MTAALPGYMREFSDAAPGHRFSLYYAGWNTDFSKPPGGATKTLKGDVCPLPKHSRDLQRSIEARQAALAADASAVFTYPAIATAPFATGLGNEHPLENGFSFLSPYGLPYLPGSGVKGVIRKAAEELAGGEWGQAQGWDEDSIRGFFGPGEEDPNRDSNPQQGALRFWDVFPAPETSVKNDRPLLTVEIMTPHLGTYYQGDATPKTSLTPNPIAFLAVAAKSRFAFHVECNLAVLTPAQQNIWQTLLQSAFDHAGKWLGFGAKTAVGYGRMKVDEGAKEQLARQAAAAERIRRQASLSHAMREIEAFIEYFAKRAEQLAGRKERPNGADHQKAGALAKTALEASDWTQEEKAAAGDAIGAWLPQVVAVDIKEVRKKLRLSTLRGPS